MVPLPSRPELQTLVEGVQQLHGMLERLLSFAEAAAVCITLISPIHSKTFVMACFQVS